MTRQCVGDYICAHAHHTCNDSAQYMYIIDWCVDMVGRNLYAQEGLLVSTLVLVVAIYI